MQKKVLEVVQLNSLTFKVMIITLATTGLKLEKFSASATAECAVISDNTFPRNSHTLR